MTLIGRVGLTPNLTNDQTDSLYVLRLHTMFFVRMSRVFFFCPTAIVICLTAIFCNLLQILIIVSMLLAKMVVHAWMG